MCVSWGAYKGLQSAAMLLWPLKVRTVQTSSESQNLVTVIAGSWRRGMRVVVTVTVT